MTNPKPKKAGTYDHEATNTRERWIESNDGETEHFYSVSKATIDSGTDFILSSKGREPVNAVHWRHYPDYQ